MYKVGHVVYSLRIFVIGIAMWWGTSVHKMSWSYTTLSKSYRQKN